MVLIRGTLALGGRLPPLQRMKRLPQRASFRGTLAMAAGCRRYSA